MTPAPGYAGVLFDQGGTLFHELPRHVSERNQYAALAAAGLPLPDDAGRWREALAAARAQLELAWRARVHYLHAELVHEHFVRGAVQAGVAAGPALDRAAAVYVATQQRDVVAQLRPRADCHETLEALRDMGCYLSVASNNSEAYLEPLLTRWRLLRHFRHWLTSDAAGACKPHPALFRVAIARSGLPAGRLLYVGDSVAADVDGARGVGLDVALLAPHRQPPGAERATWIIQSLSALPAIVAAGPPAAHRDRRPAVPSHPDASPGP